MKRNLRTLLLTRVYNGRSTTIFCVTSVTSVTRRSLDTTTICFHIFFNYSQLFALRSVYCVFSVFWGNILLIASEVLAIISGVWHQTQLTHLVTHWLMSLMFQWTTTPILTWYSEPLYLHASALPVSAVLQRDALWACLAKRCFCNTLSERT